ncbi:MAG: four helix bundle protein [Thiobacillus sp.]|nr:four helix bundle protein [Thiobacillus sp.]
MRRSHRDLRVWQEGISLVEDAYRLTSSFPRDEIYGLTSQIRRAAVSVPANIAEGSARKGTKELLYFLNVATGSLSELDTHIEIATRLGYVSNTDDLKHRMDTVSALLLALIESLKRKQAM